MNRLFRTPNKSNKPSGLKSPGTAVPDAVRSMGAGAMIGANNSVDLSTKIDPYTFGTNITPSPSPSPYSTNTPSTTNTTTNNNSSNNSSAAVSPLSHIHTGLPIHAPLQTRAPSISNHGHGHPHHTHATSAADGYTDPTLVPPPARRHSLRARSSSEEPWVVVSDGGNGMDSRSGSFASSFMSDTTPGGANTASGQITPNPSLYNSNSSGPYGSSAAGTPFDVTNPSSPIQQQPQQPSQPQTQRGTGATGGAGVANTRAPAGPPKANGVYADMQNTGGTVGPVPSGGAPRAPMESMENQGYQNANFNTLRDKDKESIHSQQDKTGSWARGIFGGNTTSARDKEANVELMRMIGFLVAAAPDDWNLVLEVCDRASASESAAKEAARALRKEFSHGEPSAQLSAARLWAIMLQNANDLFILQTASRKFLENLEEVINAERTSPVVRERLLDVLASAAYTYGKKPGKEGYASTWKKVRPSWKPPEGVPFDPEDVLFGSAFPRRVPPGQVPLQQQQQQGAQYYGSQPQPPQNYGIGRGDDRDHGRDSTNTGTYGRGDRDGNGRSGDRTERDKEKHRRERERDKYNLQQQRQLEQLQQQGFRTYNTPQAPPRKDRGIIPPEEDIRRLFQECDVAKNNAQVLSGALPFATPANFSSDPVIQEFYNKCRASQELIMAQIAWASAGAERSRLAAEKAAKDSGSDNGPNRLTRQAKPGREGRNNGSDDLTKEERLLAALLSASTELMEVFKEYEQLEQMARTEKEEREVAKRSMADTRMDRTQIHLIKPDGSVVDAPAAANAGSSSRSPSPAIPASTRSISGTTVPTVASNAAAAKGAGGRDLPLPPHMSGEHLVTPGATPITPNAPINYPPQQQPGAPASQQQGPPYHHQHHSSTHSINNYNTATLNLPPAAPHGPRHPPSNNRSRTPSPDRPGVVSGTVPGTTSPPLMEYGPPSHPPPQHGQRGGAGGARYDSLRSGNRTESPVPGGAPPGLGGTHNVAGMRIDTDAAHRYSSDEENLMTPIRPSAKALGKRRAEVEAPPDEEELERREEEELEEAFYRSTIPVDAETPTRTVYYVYDAAAERAKELDRLEKEEQEKERLKALQARNSILRGSGGGSGTAAAAAAGGAGAQQQQPLGAVNNPRI